MAKEKTNQEHRAYLLWAILVNSANKNEFITYKEAAEKMGVHHRVLKYPLGLIQQYCLKEKLPPLTILVINAKTGVPGDGFIAWDIDDKATAIKKVYEENWHFENPFLYAKNEKDTQDTIAKKILENSEKPNELVDIYQKIKNRGVAQIIFRETLMNAYNCECAFCGLNFDILEAAHIIPWNSATPDQRISPKNGLLLCPTHHKLYDDGFLWVDEKYNIISYDPNKTADSPYSEADLFTVDKLNNKQINLPKNTKYYPDIEYLNKANAIREVEQD